MLIAWRTDRFEVKAVVYGTNSLSVNLLNRDYGFLGGSHAYMVVLHLTEEKRSFELN